MVKLWRIKQDLCHKAIVKEKELALMKHLHRWLDFGQFE